MTSCLLTRTTKPLKPGFFSFKKLIPIKKVAKIKDIVRSPKNVPDFYLQTFLKCAYLKGRRTILSVKLLDLELAKDPPPPPGGVLYTMIF